MTNRKAPSKQFPLRRMLSWLTGFHGLPYMAGPTFRYEQSGIIAGSLGVSVAMGGFCQFFATNGLSVPDWMLAALAASMAAGNLPGAALTGTLRRWRQPAVAGGCMFLAAAMTAAVALLPKDHPWAGLVFTALMVAVTSLIMIGFQARVAIWQANYPAGMRGGIVSRNFIVQTALIALLSQAMSGLLDWHGGLYRVIYLGGAVSFAVSGMMFRRIRVRGEALRLKRNSQNRPSFDPLAIVRVLVRDRSFATYLGLQLLLGIFNLAVIPIIPKVLKEVFDASYTEANIALMALPMAAQILAMPMLGSLFDRISIFRYRSLGASMWGLSRFLLAVGIAMVAMPMVAVSMVIVGISMTFARLAWSAGHMAFAKPEETHLYMGAHMMLTGLRGVTMPFIGMWLYNHVMGIHLIWICAAAQLLVAVAFWIIDPHRPMPQATTSPPGTLVP